MKDFKEQYDAWTAFALETVRDAVELVNKLGGRGVEVVAGRAGEYRYWDPETLKVDRDCENLFRERLEKYRVKGVMLSEEAGTVALQGDGGREGLNEEILFVSDPFDGSLLYKRQIPAFWYTTLAVFRRGAQDAQDNLCCAIGDCAARSVDFCTREAAYTGQFQGGGLVNVKKLQPNDTTELKSAFVESYLLKPHYLYPFIEDWKPLFRQVKFVHPNGGPSGFSDVAAGRCDVYVAHKQPFVDVWSGLPVAEKAGCVLTDFAGNPVRFTADINARFHVICSCNPKLHQQVLETVKQCRYGPPK